MTVPSASSEQRTREIEAQRLREIDYRLRQTGGLPISKRPSNDADERFLWGLVMETRDLLRAREQETAEANTRLHSLRWLLGLDTHEGEDSISDLEAIANLRALRSNEGATVTACAAVRDATEAQITARAAIRVAIRFGGIKAERAIRREIAVLVAEPAAEETT